MPKVAAYPAGLARNTRNRLLYATTDYYYDQNTKVEPPVFIKGVPNDALVTKSLLCIDQHLNIKLLQR